MVPRRTSDSLSDRGRKPCSTDGGHSPVVQGNGYLGPSRVFPHPTRRGSISPVVGAPETDVRVTRVLHTPARCLTRRDVPTFGVPSSHISPTRLPTPQVPFLPRRRRLGPRLGVASGPQARGVAIRLLDVAPVPHRRNPRHPFPGPKFRGQKGVGPQRLDTGPVDQVPLGWRGGVRHCRRTLSSPMRPSQPTLSGPSH